MKFFDFRQNNSGGGHDIDEDSGIGVHVIVEAESADDANRRAEDIGLYFDGCDDNRDCPCCGDRWYRQYPSDGEDVMPRPYDWSEGYGPSFVHFADGRFERVLPGDSK